MSVLIDERLNLFLLSDVLWMLTKPTGKPIYDFQFEQFFQCEHKWRFPPDIEVIARVGAREDYRTFYNSLLEDGIRLMHTPEQHDRCSELPYWYPLIQDLTPHSLWFAEIPSVEQITEVFNWPIFMKGSRQTSKHQRRLSIIDSPEAFLRIRQEYAEDSILHWQDVVCREYVQLRPVEDVDENAILASFEFRTFWWKNECVGTGQYWSTTQHYNWTEKEKQDALSIAAEVARRVNVPFLVVDVAQRIDGQWIVIECNDGHESGYAGVSPFALWKNIITIEQKHSINQAD